MRADERHMQRALELSARHDGQTGPNPSVGCVIVKDNKVVGEAVTAKGGRPHAETQALDIAGKQAKGATAYVTLEPCAHIGETPSCAEALISAGISRCVIALIDPDPRTSRQGMAKLRRAGVSVELGRGRNRSRRLLKSWLASREN